MNAAQQARLKWLIAAFTIAGCGLLALFFSAAQTEQAAFNLPIPFAGWLNRTPTAIMPLRPPDTPLADSPSVTIAAAPYHHPSGAFSIRYPDNWQIDEAEDSVLFTAPDDSAEYSITFWIIDPNTPAPLDELASSELLSSWGDLPAFSLGEADTASAPDRWSAPFSFDQTLPPYQEGAHLIGLAIFQMQSGVMFHQIYLAQAGLHDQMESIFQSIADSLVVNPQVALISQSE